MAIRQRTRKCELMLKRNDTAIVIEIILWYYWVIDCNLGRVIAHGKPSFTALTAAARAAHLIVDMLPAAMRDAAGQMYADLVGQAAAEWGEPWRSVFAPAAMAALLARHGFGPARDVGQRDMIPAAAWDRSDALRPAELSRIAHAAIHSG